MFVTHILAFSVICSITTTLLNLIYIPYTVDRNTFAKSFDCISELLDTIIAFRSYELQ